MHIGKNKKVCSLAYRPVYPAHGQSILRIAGEFFRKGALVPDKAIHKVR